MNILKREDFSTLNQNASGSSTKEPNTSEDMKMLSSDLKSKESDKGVTNYLILKDSEELTK
jgi:hypothetical protein